MISFNDMLPRGEIWTDLPAHLYSQKVQRDFANSLNDYASNNK